MKTNLLNYKQRPQTNLPKHGFAMDNEFAFTSSTGMLLPIYHDLLNAGETVHFKANLFARTQPLVTAALSDVDVYIDWFFVPMSMLYTAFPNLRYMTNDVVSSFWYEQQFDGNLPVFDLNSVASSIGDFFEYSDISSLLSSSGYGSTFDCIGTSVFRLFNHLGYNPYGIFDNETYRSRIQTLGLNTSNPSVFPYALLTYQCIYQNHFRLDDREQLNVVSYNVDKTYSIGDTSVNDWFLLHYRPWNLDYFTSIKTSPMMSSVNMLGSNTGSPNTPANLLSKVNNYLYNITANTQTGPISDINAGYTAGKGDSGISYLKQTSPVNSVNTAALRSMFAVEKLIRLTGRAKKNYDSQILAHFGFDVPRDIKHELSFLGEDKALLHIGEVVSTADTFNATSADGSALGSISGKGYVNLNGKKRKFTAPCDGVFMAIYSSVPRLRYYQSFDKINAITNRLDLYTPEFDRLGMQPLYSYEANTNSIGSANRLGWQYRYEQFKRKYNRVSEAFRIPFRSDKVNQYGAWMTSRQPFAPLDSGVYADNSRDAFICPPTALNSIMVMDYQPGWDNSYVDAPWLMFATDPFINLAAFDVTKVSTMSEFGEPNLNGI